MLLTKLLPGFACQVVDGQRQIRAEAAVDPIEVECDGKRALEPAEHEEEGKAGKQEQLQLK